MSGRRKELFQRCVDCVVRIVNARLVVAEDEDALRIQAERDAAFEFLRRFDSADRFGFRRAGEPAEIGFGEALHLFRIDVPHNSDNHVARLVIGFEEVDRVFT